MNEPVVKDRNKIWMADVVDQPVFTKTEMIKIGIW